MCFVTVQPTKLCSNSQYFLFRRLTHAKTEIAINGLEVLSKNRRKVLLQKLLKSLRFIKTLQETDVRLKELLQVSQKQKVYDFKTMLNFCVNPLLPAYDNHRCCKRGAT